MTLEMFTFSKKRIPTQIFEYISENQVEIDDVQLVDNIMVLYAWCTNEEKKELIDIKQRFET